MRVLIGYFIARRIKDEHRVRGKTFSAYGHRLYPTRTEAHERLLADERMMGLDPRYDYDIAEAYMHVEDENG